MGSGGRGRGGSTSRHEGNESSREKKESNRHGDPAETDVSADEIRKMVAKFLKELSSNTNPKKAPRLLNRISEEKIRALGLMSKLKYVTDPIRVRSSSTNTSRPRRAVKSGSSRRDGTSRPTSTRSGCL